MPLDELRAASELLSSACDRYINACLSAKHSLASPIGSTLANELSMLAGYEAKLRDARIVVSQTANLCSNLVPISRIPVEILVRIFQVLVDMPGRHQRLPHIPGIPLYPLLLSHVCSSWRRLVHDSPSLWSQITIFPNGHTTKYLDFHSSQAIAKKALLDIFIFNSAVPDGPSTYHSFDFTVPESFTGRIKSLELRFYDPHDTYLKADRERLLAKCLRACNTTLKRFALNIASPPQRFPPNNNPEASARSVLTIDLPNDQFGDTLSSITDLWLRGAYFPLDSKAYHGLVSLRLTHSDSYPSSILNVDLLNVLESSPRLRFIDIDLQILLENPDRPPDRAPVYLPDLEVVVGCTSLLQLIRPGSNELTVSIFQKFNYIDNAHAEDFFACASLVAFYSDHFLRNPSDICHLRSIAPRLRSLAVAETELAGVLPDTASHAPLDTLYVLNNCKTQWSLLEDIINKWAIKRLVFDQESYVIRGEEHILPNDLEKELSSLSATIQLELLPAEDDRAAFNRLFFGPPPRD